MEVASLRAICCVLASLVLAGCLDEAVSSSTPVDTYGARDGYLRVVDALALPCPDVPVLLDGAVLRTDWDGYVKLPDKSGGHDMALIANGSVFAYRGFSFRAPVVHTWGGCGNASEVKFKASWEDDPYDGVNVSVAAAITNPRPVHQQPGVNGGFGVVSGRVRWTGADPAILTLEAFQTKRDMSVSGSLRQFTGYARVDRLVTSGDQVDWTPSFEPPTFDTSPIVIECSSPTEPGHVTASPLMFRGDGSIAIMPGGEVCNGTPLMVPVLPDTWFQLSVESYKSGALATTVFRGLRGGEVLHATFQTPPEVIEPEQDATGVGLETPLAWTTQPGAIHMVRVTALDADAYPRSYTITSAVAEARLPDLTPLGVALPSEKRYVWRPELVFGCASLDDSMAGTCTPTGTASPAPREFTTAP